MRIHWCGTGLSSGPGLRGLIAAGHPVTVWSDPVAQGVALAGDLTDDIRPYGLGAVDAALAQGDIVVSMLPAGPHADLARHCVGHGAHFIWPGYITPELAALDDRARRAGSVVLGEVGLSPGIDHLLAHDLVAAYRAAAAFHPDNVLNFTSLCGGFPAAPDAFRYKFAASPADDLRALRTPARYRRDFTDLTIAHPWDAVRPTVLPLPKPESFELFPNRDSLAYLPVYRFDPHWQVREFLRANLRPLGWADAWQPVFAALAGLPAHNDDAAEAQLAALAESLGAAHAYAPGEADRAVLSVTLRAERAGRPVWQQGWILDATGDVRGSAMARLVSGPVALAAGAVMARELPAGVHPMPHDPRLVARWIAAIAPLAQTFRRTGA